MPRNKVVSKTNKLGIRACDENMGECDSVTAKGAGGIVSCSGLEMIQVVGVKGMSRDKLKHADWR